MVYRLAECVGSTPLQHLTVAPSMQSLEGSHRVPSISFLLQEGDARMEFLAPAPALGLFSRVRVNQQMVETGKLLSPVLLLGL